MTTNLNDTVHDIMGLISHHAPKALDMPRSPQRDAIFNEIIADYFETDYADDALRHSIVLSMLNSRI